MKAMIVALGLLCSTCWAQNALEVRLEAKLPSPLLPGSPEPDGKPLFVHGLHPLPSHFRYITHQRIPKVH